MYGWVIFGKTTALLRKRKMKLVFKRFQKILDDFSNFEKMPEKKVSLKSISKLYKVTESSRNS
jgi:hypothetical protein